MKAESQLDRREFIKLLGAAALTYGAAASWRSPGKSEAQRESGGAPNVLILLFDTAGARPEKARRSVKVVGLPMC
jgi:hypothetical protein